MLGKRKQDVSVSGGLVHAHTRDPFLAGLPQEALEELARAYDTILIKHVPNALPDGPQNQIESKTAIGGAVRRPGKMSRELFISTNKAKGHTGAQIGGLLWT